MRPVQKSLTGLPTQWAGTQVNPVYCTEHLAPIDKIQGMKRLIPLLLSAVLLTSFAAAALGNDLDDGNAAFEKKDYAQALAKFESAAAKGNPKAQYNLAVMHAQGLGTSQNFAKAEKLFEAAATSDFAQAQIALGLMYSEGRGVAKDDAKAMHWYRKAAQQGNAWAQFGLGSMYYAGRGGSNDHVRAHMWLSLAAQAGLADAADGRDLVAEGMSADQVKAALQLAKDCQAQALKSCN